MVNVVRWVLMPLTVIVLGLVWAYSALSTGVQEVCFEDCAAYAQRDAWRFAFLVALGLWLVTLWVLRHHGRRKTDDSR